MILKIFVSNFVLHLSTVFNHFLLFSFSVKYTLFQMTSFFRWMDALLFNLKFCCVSFIEWNTFIHKFVSLGCKYSAIKQILGWTIRKESNSRLPTIVRCSCNPLHRSHSYSAVQFHRNTHLFHFNFQFHFNVCCLTGFTAHAHARIRFFQILVVFLRLFLPFALVNFNSFQNAWMC